MKLFLLKFFNAYNYWLIITLGLLVRLAIIDKHDFWIDEAYSLYIAKLPVWQLLKVDFFDTAPPLYYLTVKFWLLFGRSIYFVRLLSVIFNLVTIYFSIQLIKLFTSKKILMFIVLLFSLSPLQTYYAVETRMYALWTLEITLLFYTFVRFLNTPNKLHAFSYSIIAIISLYTHYFTWIFLLSLNLILFLRPYHLKKYHHWWLSQLLILGVSIPWMMLILSRTVFACHCFPFYIAIPVTLVSFAINGLGMVSLKSLFLSESPLWVKLILIIQVATTVYFFMKGIWISRVQKNVRIVIHFLIIPLIITFLISIFRPYFSPRGLIPLTLFFYFFVVYGLNVSRYPKPAKLLIISLFFASIFITQQRPFYENEPLAQASNYLYKNTHPEDIIIHTGIYSFFPFIYYQPLSNPQQLIRLPEETFSVIFESSSIYRGEDLGQKTNRVFVVHLPNRTDNRFLSEIDTSLSLKFSFMQKLTFKNLEIYEYIKK